MVARRVVHASLFKKYFLLFFIGFIGGSSTWAFSLLFERFFSSLNSFSLLFFASLFVSVVWFVLFSYVAFFLLRLFGVRLFDR